MFHITIKPLNGLVRSDLYRPILEGAVIIQHRRKIECLQRYYPCHLTVLLYEAAQHQVAMIILHRVTISVHDFALTGSTLGLPSSVLLKRCRVTRNRVQSQGRIGGRICHDSLRDFCHHRARILTIPCKQSFQAESHRDLEIRVGSEYVNSLLVCQLLDWTFG